MAGGGHDIDPDALARADAALAALNDDYLRWVAADVAALGAAVAELQASSVPVERAAVIARVFEIAHDIKGQGATFDYPLMTRLGQVTCDLVRAWENGGGGDGLLSTRLDALAAAMAEVVAARLCGDGGARGRDLVSRLKVQCPGL